MAYKANGQVKEAVGLLEQVVAIRRERSPKTTPDRLASQHALAIAYKANGQVKEAVGLLETSRRHSGERRLAEDHPDRLASQHELAIAYEANGQVKENRESRKKKKRGEKRGGREGRHDQKHKKPLGCLSKSSLLRL